jgi:tRNA pseudouridine55 synthase
MKGFFNRPEHFFLALIAAFGVYISLFMYFHISSYKQNVLIPAFQEFSKIEEEIKIAKENIEVPDQNSGELKNLARNNEDKRIKSEKDWSENTSSEDPAQTIKDFEKKLFEEAGGEKKREKIESEAERKKVAKNEKSSKTDLINQHLKPNQYNGDVMVDFSLAGRTAYNNNNWFIRNPGYTCGYGSVGTVVILIKVNSAGKVVKITFDAAKSINATSCMQEQALKYANMSRFNPITKIGSEQSGYIRYQFVAQ